MMLIQNRIICGVRPPGSRVSRKQTK